MQQLINKKKIYFYILSFLFLTTILNNNVSNFLKKKFKILEIKIDTNNDQINKIILKNTKFLIEENILFINKKEIEDKLSKLKFLHSFNVIKKYPSTIKINAMKTNLIAITYLDQKKYYVGSNEKFILASEISNSKNMPIIFGKFDVSDFTLLKEIIRNTKINEKEIVKYYFHKNNRWDLYFKNNILIQLPSKNIPDALKLYMQFKKTNKLNPNAIIDLRIKDRLILNNG